MNDVERLAEALRQANAELDVDPVELADAMDHAHGRLVRRLLLVATLSAVAAGLVLSGGLAASSAVKEHREKSTKHEKTGGKNGQPGGGNSDSGNGGKGGEEERKKSKHREGEPETLPNLVATGITLTSVEVENKSGVSVETPFFVEVTVPDTKFNERVSFDGLPANESATEEFEKPAPCSSDQKVVVVVDATDSVEETDEENQSEFTLPCEMPNEGGDEGEENGEVSTPEDGASVKAAPAEEGSGSGPD